MRAMPGCIVRSLLVCVCGWLLAGPVWSARSYAAGEPPQVREAVNRAKEFLTKTGMEQRAGALSLVAYALVKDGEKRSNPVVAKALTEVLKKTQSGTYKPVLEFQHVYEAGVDMMLLGTLSAEEFKPQMEAITRYLVSAQNPAGDWDYLKESRDGGDTSMVQYAMLGLWEAQRAKIDFPLATVEKGAAWLMRTQKSTGGFVYHPFSTKGEQGVEELGITAAGSSGIALARIILYPEANPFGPGAAQKEEAPKEKKFGVLEEVKVGATAEELAQPETNQKARVPLAGMTNTLERGLFWIGKNFSVRVSPKFHFYYLYTLERTASLAGAKLINNHDWYDEGSKFLLEFQEKDGSWGPAYGGTDPRITTSFAILFLVRATGKTIGAPDAGGGLLAGGRGLPEDLSELAMQGNEVVQEKKLGPLDELLKELSNTKSLDVEEVQQAIIEKVEIGTAEDREKLIAQKDLLLRLVNDPRAEVRRTAMWALGRTDDLRVAKQLIVALKNDNNVDVLVEARAALCVLSRRPRGFGFSTGPYDDLPEDAADDVEAQALKEWRASVFEAWRDWYLSIRPYDERDELAPFGG